MLMSVRSAGGVSVRLSVSITRRQYGVKRKGQGGVKGTFDRYAFIVVHLLFARNIGPTFVEGSAVAMPFSAAS